MTPYWSAPGATLYLGDVRECLRQMPARSVHCVVTSPPYFGLRRYLDSSHPDAAREVGAEDSPGEYVEVLVDAFRELWRVLRDDGVAWLNLGAHSDGGQLVATPWLVALALQSHGWRLLSDLPWVRRSAMPSSVESYPCRSLEYIFMLAKTGDHYFDMGGIRPGASTPAGSGGACFGRVSDPDGADRSGAHQRRYERPAYTDRAFRNSDLWFQSVETPHGIVGVGDELVGMDVTPSNRPGEGNKKLHFAVFPTKLVTPLILAGTSDYGCCASCGRPWERVVHKVVEAVRPAEENDRSKFEASPAHTKGLNNGLRGGFKEKRTDTVGWRKACGCRTTEVAPCVVLDPFVGSGTTVATAVHLGRAGIGIDLSETYLRENAISRIEAAIRGEKSSRKVTTAVSPDTRPPPHKLT